MNPDIEYVKFAKLYKETDRLLLHNYWRGNCIFRKKSLFTALNKNAALIKKLGQFIFILMTILPILAHYMKFLKQIPMPIFGVIVATLIQHSKTKCWHILTTKVGTQWKDISEG